MQIEPYTLDCQCPPSRQFISRQFTFMRCLLAKDSEEYASYLARARRLAEKVNRGAANAGQTAREPERLLRDAFGGLLAEEGWLQFIAKYYGAVASATVFTGAFGQVDIQLVNGQLIEVRSSFANNGVRFAACHASLNFKIIANYANRYKPGETAKDFYATVLFETAKTELLTAAVIEFYLIGGVTYEMKAAMAQSRDLKPAGSGAGEPTDYQSIFIKDSYDCRQFAALMTRKWHYAHLATR